MPRDLDAWLRAILLVLGVALGIFLRVQGIADMPLFGDEYHTHGAVAESYATILMTFDVVGSHVVLPLLQRISMDLFGDGVLALRLPALIPAILTLLLLYPLARPLIGATPACLATLALCFNPMHVYYSRFGRGYALLVLIGLVLGVALIRALRTGGRRWWVAVSLCAILLPYTHLSSAGFVAALGLVALYLGWRGAGLRGVKAPIVSFGTAAVVVVLLFLPLSSQIQEFFAAMPEERSRPLGWLGIPMILAGGRLAAVVWLVAFPASVALLAVDRSRRDVALVSAAALLGPLVALLVTRPHGMDYAYARYLLNALPFLLMLIAWLFCSGFEALLPESAANRSAVVAGAALVLLGVLAGPLSPSRPGTVSFGNTYLAMWPLAAFDVPHPSPPDFYRRLAADSEARRIIEVQPLQSRAVLLYRNYSLLHGKEVLVGWWDEPFPRALNNGPYVDMLGAHELSADYLVFHKDLRAEVRDYWRFVYLEAGPDEERWGEKSMMERHKATFIGGQPVAAPEYARLFVAELVKQLGPPTHDDEDLLVWKLR